MKKIGVVLTLFLLLFLLAPAFAADNDTENDTSDDTTLDTSDSESDSDKIKDGFDCLEDKADDCSSLDTQELALTILATPDNIFDDCVEELEDRKSSDNWGNIRDTALAILALQHAGEDTEPSEEWLLEQEEIPTELVWYMQQDSNEKTECHIAYKSNDYSISVGENKKIDSNAGSCLTRAQSNFWLAVSPNCYSEEFSIECDRDFIANLLYKNKQSSTIYVLEGTESSPAFDSIKLKVESKCLGKNSCDYESTIWAALALSQTGHDIEEFIPYIVALSDTNERYLPEAFIYALTSYENYATELIADQKLGNYWEAKSSAYNRIYDTSIALMSLGSSSSEQITNGRDWLLFSQGSNGCWQNSVRETAMALWALEGRGGRSSSGGGVTYCSEADYFCIPSFDCPSSENVGNSYFCASLSDTCCTSENLKSCSEYGGQQCSSNEVCIGNERNSVDISDCCTGTCGDRPQETECEANFYTCMDTCSDYQESASEYSCDQTQVCCKTKSTSEDGIPWWIWLLIFLILATLGAIGYIYRDKIKLYYFQIKSKFKKDKGKKGPGSRPPAPGMPPRPGFPPVRRAQPPMPPQANKEHPHLSDTFRKLKEMSS